MPAYVTLPGTSGNYFDTPDVNVLDADTAHLHQSVGQWTNNINSNPASASPSFGSVFGTKALRFSGAAGVGERTSSAVVGYTVAGTTQYTFSAWLRPVEAAIDQAKIRVSGSATADTDWTNISAGQWTEFTITFTTGASTSLNLVIEFRDSSLTNLPTSSEYAWASAICLRTGSDGTFVPSLRVVNDLEVEWKVALDDYTPTATNTILDCLNSNDGYRVRHTTGDLIEIAYGNGSSTRAQTSSATGLTDGTEHVFKVTVDQSTGAVVYYIDGVQHDTDTMTAGAGQPDIQDLVVGANAAASANWTAGDIYYVIVRDGIDGPLLARFDAEDWVGV